MKAYYNTETRIIETEREILESFNLFRSEYETETDFLSACMWYNNGVLIGIDSHIRNLENDYRNEYEFMDETERKSVQNEIDTIRKLYLEV